ncbi:hypothetical protein HanIR_Chr16g0843831 [Helianthus annuus]|nr:hypothetical protein HanIR_Chr16g0843831 [Helianthus annuus]
MTTSHRPFWQFSRVKNIRIKALKNTFDFNTQKKLYLNKYFSFFFGKTNPYKFKFEKDMTLKV